MENSKIILTIALVLSLLSSCTTQKRLSYVRDVNSETAQLINQSFKSYGEAHILIGDAMTISVNALDAASVVVFNLPLVSYGNLGSNKLNTQYSLQHYKVDVNGDIDFPVLGKLHVVGLTVSQLKDELTQKLSAYVSNPVVTIQLISFRVTVCGEVARPGQYAVVNERVTIFDALAMAGDMTPYGKRENVLVAREKDGKLELTRLNLNSSEVFLSPYYYLQQNDVVYVEPNHARAVASQNLPIYFSALSTLASMATVIVTVVTLTKK